MQRNGSVESMKWVLYFDPYSPEQAHLRDEVRRSELTRVSFMEAGFGVSPKLVTPSGSYWRGTRVIRNVLIHGSFLNTFRTEARHAESQD